MHRARLLAVLCVGHDDAGQLAELRPDLLMYSFQMAWAQVTTPPSAKVACKWLQMLTITPYVH